MTVRSPTNFIWFWSFWHWSKDSIRAGSLFRGPLHGIAGHWDEWFRSEASVQELQAIEITGQSEATQRRFIAWILRHWSREAGAGDNRIVPRFVLGQLGQVSPFKHWSTLTPYRESYATGGVAALVLADGSGGESADVRALEVLALPPDAAAPSMVAEGFQIDGVDLAAPKQAAHAALGGEGFWVLLGLWIAGGRRPYPRWLRVILALGWLTTASMIGYLLFGPDPGSHLLVLEACLLGLWLVLLAHAGGVVAWQSYLAWREGRRLSEQLRRNQLHLRMNGGLTVQGSSAGLCICLNTLLATYRGQLGLARRSWIWRSVFGHLESHGRHWAATGSLTATGRIYPVVLDAKLRACLRHGGIKFLLAPHQREARQSRINSLAGTHLPTLPSSSPPVAVVGPRMGYASDRTSLTSHRCRHLAQSLMAIGGLSSRWQFSLNSFALLVTVAMLLALPDLRNTLLPPKAPAVVAPVSTSPYYLWVSLDTKHPAYFHVLFESAFWANRSAEVRSYGGATASVRAEIPLSRIDRQDTRDEENGIVWVERRRRFLTRELDPGERVGRYTLTYLNHLGQ